ncbi:MAG TPA: hypothetical protein PK491_13760, partial [Candidatus Hydrogenedentes bacterium]|nr:hypothetical protein [Candidatus Hydrogenedentota bacterium]
KNWIKVSPQTIPCKPPTESGMVMERIEVRIDRSRITSTGKHTGDSTACVRNKNGHTESIRRANFGQPHFAAFEYQ